MSNVEESIQQQFIVNLAGYFTENQRLCSSINEILAFLRECKTFDCADLSPRITQLYELLCDTESLTEDQIRCLKSILNREMIQAPDEDIFRFSRTPTANLDSSLRKKQKVSPSDSDDTPIKKISSPQPFVPIPPGSSVVVKRVQAVDEEWMLATMLFYDSATNRYTVEDVEEDDDDEDVPVRSVLTGATSKKRYIVEPVHVRMLPESDSVALRKQDYSVGAIVLALFPNTTCLYPAQVLSVPTKRKKVLEYTVKFDNDEMDGVIPARSVPARFVLDILSESSPNGTIQAA